MICVQQYILYLNILSCRLISKLKKYLGVVANELDCDIVVNEFELQSLYYVHFRTNTLRKGMNLFVLTSFSIK